MAINQRVIEALAPLIGPYILVKVAIGLAALVLLMGAVVSAVTDDWVAFSRSGALVVALALVLALVDYTGSTRAFLKRTNRLMLESEGKGMKQAMDAHVRERLTRHGLEKSDAEIEFIVESEWESYWAAAPQRLGDAFRVDSLRVEISLAIVGTLVWGFGDLLG